MEKWAHGFEEYKDYCKQFTVEKTAEICEVAPETIQAAIDILLCRVLPLSARALPPSTAMGLISRAIQLLIPLTGSLDVLAGLPLSMNR